MGKYLRSLKDGSLRCRYCGDSECNCMDDGITQVAFVAIFKETPGGRLVQLRRQTLPNGKRIPAKVPLWIPKNVVSHVDEILKTMDIDNDYLNRLRFD